MMSSYNQFIFFLFFTVTIQPNSSTLPATFPIDPVATNHKDPLFISTIGGLGAKLPLAERMHKNEAIGFDLVAHCVNELIAHNAQPLFFSTYVAADSLQNQTERELFNGITTACLQSKCTLKSSQTSEMKKLFHENQYDIGGFALGIIEKDQPLPAKETITVGDLIIGLTTSGIHASSFTKIESLIDYYNMDITVPAPFVTLHASLTDALLAPITIYDSFLSSYQQKYIKAITHVTHGGLENAIMRSIPSHLKAKIELHRWPLPPLFRWLKQITKGDVSQMAQEFNLGIGMLFIVDPLHANSVITKLRTKKISAIPIGIIEQRPSDVAPISWIGTIGTSYSRILIIGNSAQDHAFAWKLAQSPYIERVFITPGNGGTSNEQKVENLPINPHHHGALIAYAQQNNIDLVIVTTRELLDHGIVNEFRKANIACLGPTKKSVQLATQPHYARDFMQKYAIPVHNGTSGTAISFAILTDGTTTTPLTACQQYKKRYNNDTGPDTDGMGVCCPAPGMTQRLENRIMNEIIKPTLAGLKNEDVPLCGFLAVDLVITQEGNPFVHSFHFNLGNSEAPAMMLRLQTDFFKLCYAACYEQLNLIEPLWNRQSSVSVALTDPEQRHEIIVGVPEDTMAKVFHMHTIYKEGKYQTNGIQPLVVTALGETLEKARNNAYKIVQQIYWPTIEYRKDIGYREITRINH